MIFHGVMDISCRFKFDLFEEDIYFNIEYGGRYDIDTLDLRPYVSYCFTFRVYAT